MTVIMVFKSRKITVTNRSKGVDSSNALLYHLPYFGAHYLGWIKIGLCCQGDVRGGGWGGYGRGVCCGHVKNGCHVPKSR